MPPISGCSESASSWPNETYSSFISALEPVDLVLRGEAGLVHDSTLEVHRLRWPTKHPWVVREARQRLQDGILTGSRLGSIISPAQQKSLVK
jgi:hypothetical protein